VINIKLKPKQKKDLDEILSILDGEPIAVLACSTGYGKTIVAWKLIDELLSKPKSRVLVLAHGRKEIRDNFADSIGASGKKFVILDEAKKILKARRSRLVLTLPQTLKSISNDIGKFDYLIFDEAHQYYEASMVQDMLMELDIKKHILLTSTHYTLNFPKVFCSRETLLKEGSTYDAKITMMPTRFSPDFYNDYTGGELTEKDSIPAPLAKSIIKLLNGQKTMIIMHNIKSVSLIEKVLKKSKIKYLVSHSYCDGKSSRLNKFKIDDTEVLVVVNRGNLGFDLPDLANVVDLTFSKNIERIEQIFGRVSRKSPKQIEKIYYKIVPKDYLEEFKIVMAGVMALGLDEIYRNYQGNINDLPILQGPKLWSKSYGDGCIDDDGNDLDFGTALDFEHYKDIFRKSKDAETEVVNVSQALIMIKNKTPWLTKAGCLSLSKGFADRASWKDEHHISHNHATKKKWMVDICELNGWPPPQRPAGYWTFDRLKEKAALSSSLIEWSKDSPTTYKTAINRKIHKIIAKELGWKIQEQRPQGYWTYKRCLEYAKQNENFNQLKKAERGCYEKISLNKWQDSIASELGWKTRTKAIKRTYDECRDVANKWPHRDSFKKNDRSAYDYAKAMQWLSDISKDLGWKIPKGERRASKITDAELKKICKQFETKMKLKIHNRKIYDILRVRNLLDEYFK